MGEITSRNFGILIAYLLPGFVVLLGLATLSDTVAAWVAGTQTAAPTLGGFLYVTAGSVAAGMIASAFRWLFVDTVHHATGLKRPEFDDSRLSERLSAIEMLIEIHYRYYQFYANMLVALIFTHIVWRWGSRESHIDGIGIDLALLAVDGVLFAGSRDALGKYYRRVSRVLGDLP
ncbi:MAG: hypothetical protein KDA16_00470 [Phycisphaerales bacterium]|nr:hypothetical protein [Phycisphaerales bacterium]